MSVLELDTAAIAGVDRLGVWVETIGNAFGPFGIAHNDPERFHGRVRVERRQDIRFIELGYEGHAFRRSARDVSKLDDAYCSLLRPRTGRLLLVQDGVEHVLEPGQYYLVNHSVPYETMPQAGYETMALAFPPQALSNRVLHPKPFYALRHDPASPRWQLLDAFLTQYTAGRAQWGDAEFETLTQQLLDLVVLSIVEPGQQASASETATRAAHRTRALRHIRAHLADRALSPRHVAEGCGISLAYLQEIFRGTGVEETIFAERLDRAAAQLRSQAHACSQVAGIAYGVGFSDPAHFARAFRRRFSTSPSAWRAG